ncbi:hypothetical protein J40TS1_44450 [Paenibacillus montaniterrae]|uniref:Peptidase M1 membrane alanine aminopeptidase domain-containing protein n=1 Tax=Paenibacillus montaniterrae TaxID=429341 RepID=A0A920D0Q4_9BACL|nr:M1 family metallopeptidase [Paenibacillus montaniterrae]GIP18803.1 hypothetical protein J40TS1_44450 [Paenibacillus montaniterrae]
MSEKPHSFLLLGLLIVVFLFATWPYQFQHAWQSGYTYALTPVNIEAAPAMAAVASNESKPSTSLPINHELGTISSQPALSERIVNYHIQVSLNEEQRMLEGEEIFTWRNPGKKQVTDLYLHLYANAFQSSETTFMKESGGKLRSDQATANSEGYINLTSLETLEGENLLPRLKYVSPDDANEQDRTVATFRLIEPLAPGEEVTLRLKFEVKLPEVFARMGYFGDFIMAGQWFPKVAAYETAGTRNRAEEGWNVHQYHGNSEFYSNFGVYSVKIHVPEHYVVAATGMQTKVANLGQGRKVVHFYAEDVHDFAFALSPDFITHETSFSTESIPGVKIKLYVDPEHESLAERYLHAAKSALAYYGKHYGSYPYNTLSIVVPPRGASGAGGMEYPTLVTALAADEKSPGYELERTVVHEIGHQYWYGIVANNEFEEAWLDEAFTSYAEEKVMENAYGVTTNHRIEAVYLTDPAPLKLNAWEYKDHQHYAENVYMRGKLLLLDIEQIIGSDQMNRVMRSYFQAYRFKHPTTAQFQALLEQVTKQSWQDYFDRHVYSSETNDLAVTKIEARQKEEMNKQFYEYTILLQQNSAVNRNVPIELVYADGSIVRKAWQIGEEANVHFVERSEVPLLYIQLDPDQSNMLDTKLNNNFIRAELPEKERKSVAITTTSLLDALLRLLSW